MFKNEGQKIIYPWEIRLWFDQLNVNLIKEYLISIFSIIMNFPIDIFFKLILFVFAPFYLLYLFSILIYQNEISLTLFF